MNNIIHKMKMMRRFMKNICNILIDIERKTEINKIIENVEEKTNKNIFKKK